MRRIKYRTLMKKMLLEIFYRIYIYDFIIVYTIYKLINAIAV